MFKNFSIDVDDVFKPFILTGLEKDVDLNELSTLVEINVVNMIAKRCDSFCFIGMMFLLFFLTFY